MASGPLRLILAISAALQLLPLARAQGAAVDYERARTFLHGNLQHSIYIVDVNVHWIGKSSRFWYRKVGPKGSEFIVVDAERNTSEPAFDHAKLASALAESTKREVSSTDLPFDAIELADDGKSVTFNLESSRWTCVFSDYKCTSSPAPKPDEPQSPDKKWTAYVKDHNLYVRNLSTGTSVQLTQDGVSGWDYATPLPALRLLVEQKTEDVKQPAGVFWSPDSSKLITYRIDSRNAGRFTSLQFVPPDQLRPRAFTYVYPLPGEVLAKAAPIIFEVQSGKRIDVKTDPIELPFHDGPGFDWFPDSKAFWDDNDDRWYQA